MTDPPEAPSSPPSAPYGEQGMPPQTPTAYPYAPLPRPSSWPTVIGVISIVWGSFGLLGGCCSVGMTIFWEPYVEFISSIVPPNQQQQQQEMLEQFGPDNPLMMVLMIISLALAILLIVSGIRVTRRRVSGVRLSKTYAYLYIPVVIASGLLTLSLQTSMSTGPSPISEEFEAAITVASALAGVLFGCAWPVFLLIWFSRSSIKEETAGWP